MFQKLLKPALWLRAKARSLSQDQRASLYKWGAKLVPVLLVAGYLTDETAQVVLLLLGLILGTGTAVVAKSNTPKLEKGAVVRTFKPGD